MFIEVTLFDGKIKTLVNTNHISSIQPFTEQEIKERKENLKENRWYQDLLEARKNLNIKVNFDIIDSGVIE